MTDSVKLNSLNGELLEIAKICNLNGDSVLSGEEINIFNAAKAEYSANKCFYVRGKKYVPDIFSAGTLKAGGFKEEKLYSTTWETDATTTIRKPAPIIKVQTAAKKDDVFADYDRARGEELAKVAYRDRNKKKVKNKKGVFTDFLGQCAAYVKRALVKVGLLPEYVSGNGCDMDNILDKTTNWKRVPVDKVDLNKLPPGCVLVFEAGVSNYDKTYGHTEISLGDTIPEAKYKAVSDGVTSNIRKPSAIYYPVKRT